MLELKTKIYTINTGHTVVGFIDPVTFKRRRKKFKTKSEAKTFKKELEISFYKKGPSVFNQTLVSTLMKAHLDNNSDSRVTDRKNHFLSFCEDFGHLPINHVNKINLTQWFKKIKETEDLSDRTLSHIKSNLNSFFKDLEDQDVITESPLKKIRFDRKPPLRRQRVVLSVSEVKALLENAKKFDSNFLYPFLFTLAYTGARRSEILKLKKSDIDFNMGLIHFKNTKNGEDRSILIPKSLKEFLEVHLTSNSSPWAFPDENGKFMDRSKLQRKINRFKKHFPMGKDWGPHALRHSYAYNFLKQGGKMYQLQAILGHKSIDVTIDVYGQIGAQDVNAPCPYENTIS